MANLLPCSNWLKGYSGNKAGQDGLAAVIVTLMLIPQSLAYAMLAGLPPVAGLYASILPLLAYTLFGTSSTLSVGPVAVISLMTATALAPLFAAGSQEYMVAAMVLALLSGAILMVMALLRLGFLANFLSHPVVSGFISASGLLIAIGQLQHILGIAGGGHNVLDMLWGLAQNLSRTHGPTLAIGTASLILLMLARSHLKGWLSRLRLSPMLAANLSKAGPVVTLLLAIAVVSLFDLADRGVAVVGAIPRGFPPLSVPTMELQLLPQLLPAALLISLVGFVESVSVGQTLAAKRRQRIDPNQELFGLGSANIAAAVSGGFPVTGGFSRSVVNFDAGAATPMAGAFTALGISLTVLFFTPLFHNLPQAVLAATIIVAVLSLVDLGAFMRTWRYSRADALAMITTVVGVLLVGVEAGILMGVGLSLGLFLKRTSQPHIAVVGQLPGSQHFRNINRYAVVESPQVLSLRVDESLYFPNARYLEDRVAELTGSHPDIKHVVLMCSAVNLIDASALESLHTIKQRLHDAGIQLHLSEVKGPVMDQLRKSDFLEHLGGQVFVSQYDALKTLDPGTTQAALEK
ncbi:sulfate permease [Pseudomaricurvus alcaniphilus]|nr:sulfate permease [Pseudomaricurvus alcaniphilus]